MVRLVCLGTTYWTVLNNLEGYVPGAGFSPSLATGPVSERPSPRPPSSSSASSTHSPHMHSHPHTHSKSGSPHTPTLSTPFFGGYMSGPGVAPIPIAPAGGLPAGMSMSMGMNMGITPTPMSSVGSSPRPPAAAKGSSGHGRSASGNVLELEQWPKRRAAFHFREWVQWLGCEDGEAPEHQEFAFR